MPSVLHTVLYCSANKHFFIPPVFYGSAAAADSERGRPEMADYVLTGLIVILMQCIGKTVITMKGS